MLAAGVAGSCGETTRYPIRLDDDLSSASASRRTEAVGVVARERDRARIPELIEMLDDQDAGVRLAAGTALRELTGHDAGYEAWAAPEDRRRQQARWRRWWAEEGRATVPPPPVPAGPAVRR